MAGAKNHQYHILPPSIWPLLGSLGGLVLASGAVMWMHKMANGTLVLTTGFLLVLLTMFGWWGKVIQEAHGGDHTPIVQLHLRYGMILFIASEVMFFVGWFWAYFDFSLFPAHVIATETAAVWDKAVDLASPAVWPTKGMVVLDAFKLPL